MNGHKIFINIFKGAAILFALVFIGYTVFIIYALKNEKRMPSIRNKVKWTSIDLRMIATAIETYYVEHNAYPEMQEDGLIPNTLTTPEPYFSYDDIKFDADLIKKQHDKHPPHYYLFSESNMWILQCQGPDETYDLPASFFIQAAEAEKGRWIYENLHKYKYDPTNGSKTKGDIFRIRQ